MAGAARDTILCLLPRRSIPPRSGSNVIPSLSTPPLRRPAMPKGMSLHIGLNAVDPKHYAGWSGDLVACEADAEDMAAIAKEKKYAVKMLLTNKATRNAVSAEIARAAKTLKAGDIFFLTYSGHGGQLPDRNGDEIDDHQDETWCRDDGEIVDDELNDLYTRFAKGVRVLILSDSCH